MHKYSLAGALLAAGIATTPVVDAAIVSTFDDLSLAPDSFFLPGNPATFVSGAATFKHEFTDFGGGCCWNGWTYSNRTDTTTPGFLNDTSAIPGSGVDGSANYGVAFLGEARITFDTATKIDGAYFTNTTYTYLAIKNGDDGNHPPFVKGPFGPGDFLALTVQGRDSTNALIGTVDVALADGAQVLDTWQWTDLSALGTVNALTFLLQSSDSGAFGINTPAYFAMDDLTVTTVPLPAADWLLGAALTGLVGLARRRQRETEDAGHC